jgi:tRNA(Ile)-lysidine synthase
MKFLGMKGYKKISDFLVDKKASLFAKEDVWILECSGEIACVLGPGDLHRISEDFKCSPASELALQIKCDFGK